MTDINEALAASRARFVTAQNNPREITLQDRDDVDTLTHHVIGLGAQIELLVPNGRNKSLALTALEDVLTRANKGIYVDRPETPQMVGDGEGPAYPDGKCSPECAGGHPVAQPGDPHYEFPQPASPRPES